MVPHLITALSGPLLELESKVLEATPTIERWFRLEWQEHTPPFYCSVDLRNAGFKLALVDTNLFPPWPFVFRHFKYKKTGLICFHKPLHDPSHCQR